MLIIKDHAVFCVDDAAPILQALPTARHAVKDGKNYIAVPFETDHMQVMQNFGLKVESPIRVQYDWPLKPGWTPGWWQIETAEFFTLNKRAHCHNAMRTRKTMSTLWAIDFLQHQAKISKALIVAPISSLELAWADSIFLNMPHRKFAVLHGSKETRRRLLEQDADIYIINHDGVAIMLDELMARKDINCVVIDECHEYKNHQTKKWQAINKVINMRGGIEYCWGLTGTPTPQGIPTDAYGQGKLITPRNYTGSFTRFKATTMVQLGPFKFIPRKNSEATVASILSPAIRFDRSVVTDLEPCLIERHAELSHEQQKHYMKLKRESVTEIRGTEVTAVNAAVLCGRIVQACCGVLYGTQREFLEIDFGPRLKVLEELIEENDEKVVVFVPFKGALAALARELKKRWTVEVIDGDVSKGKRDDVFRAFQETKNPHIIVAHPGTMSYSLDLTAASLLVWYAPPTTGNKVYQQACARIDGGHQKVKYDIAHISGTPEERRMYDVVMGRAKWQDIVLDIMKGKE